MYYVIDFTKYQFNNNVMICVVLFLIVCMASMLNIEKIWGGEGREENIEIDLSVSCDAIRVYSTPSYAWVDW
jgi:hypothetical protein